MTRRAPGRNGDSTKALGEKEKIPGAVSPRKLMFLSRL